MVDFDRRSGLKTTTGSWAHFALGGVYLLTRRFDDCLAEFELALQINPSFSPARGYYGVAGLLRPVGRRRPRRPSRFKIEPT